MAKFTNTKRIDTINKITEGYKERLNTPFNIFINLNPFVVDYWNQSIENTTSDPASNLIYKNTGRESPIRMNKIQDAVMYGSFQLQTELEIGDFGLEASDISGELNILPNTWIPYPGDYFYIKHSGIKNLFQINNVSPDTMPNGANFYKVSFEYCARSIKEVDGLVIDRFRFILDNVGTNFETIIRSTTYDDIEQLEVTTSALKRYYKNIFYDRKAQTYTFYHDGYIFYDHYMIEFFIRHHILDDDRDEYIGHDAYPLPATFAIDYDRTIFRALELRDIHKSIYTNAVAKKIESPMSLFYYRSEDCFGIEYCTTNVYAAPVPVLDMDLYNRCLNNEQYQQGATEEYKNIIIQYFNNLDIASTAIQALENIDYMNSIDLFYLVPFIIFVLEEHIKLLIKREK